VSDRDAVLKSVRQSLVKNRRTFTSWAAAASHVPPRSVHAPVSDLVSQFVEELGRLDVNVYRTAGDTGARDMIRTILTRDATEVAVLAWEEAEIGLPGCTQLLESLGARRPPSDARSAGDGRTGAVQQLAAATVGLTGVDAAIAESGTLVLAGGKGRGRLASLLAPVHVAVVRERQIVRGFGDALLRLASIYGDGLLTDRSNVTFITGPSRTADIELTLTLGVHGPREVHVIIVSE
jgi:L-lactate dehydrogenase complex protein LldG